MSFVVTVDNQSVLCNFVQADVNEPPHSTSMKVFLDQTIPNNTVFFTPVIHDGDCCDTFTLSVAASTMPCVSAGILPGDVVGSVWSTCDIAVDVAQYYNISLRVEDDGVPVLHSFFTLNVSAFVTPTLTFPSLLHLREQRPSGEELYTIGSTVSAVRYAMLPCNGSAAFAVNATTGTVTSLKSFDWETEPTEYELVIQATVLGVNPLTATATTLINIECVPL